MQTDFEAVIQLYLSLYVLGSARFPTVYYIKYLLGRISVELSANHSMLHYAQLLTFRERHAVGHYAAEFFHLGFRESDDGH